METLMQKVARAFSPGHITGFFRIWDDGEEPAKKGSTGAGFCINRGVTTEVRADRDDHTLTAISINGARTDNANVSRFVAEKMLSRSRHNHSLEIAHRVDLPVGAGFGTSGAGALSLALALNETLELDLSPVEAAEVAHAAEVECRTGLGTVVAELHGGGEIRTKPGGPTHGRIQPLPLDDDQVAISLCFGPLETGRILSDPDFRARINQHGQTCLKRLLTCPDSSTFMQTSQYFSKKLGLYTKEMHEAAADLEAHGYVCAMAMLGQTVYTLAPREEAHDILDLLGHHMAQSSTLFNCSIDRKGARLV